MSDDIAAEIDRLRAELVSKTDELAVMRQQRDEAREGLCRLIALRRRDRGWDSDPETVAAERGWNCFRDGGGA